MKTLHSFHSLDLSSFRASSCVQASEHALCDSRQFDTILLYYCENRNGKADVFEFRWGLFIPVATFGASVSVVPY